MFVYCLKILEKLFFRFFLKGWQLICIDKKMKTIETDEVVLATLFLQLYIYLRHAEIFQIDESIRDNQCTYVTKKI